MDTKELHRKLLDNHGPLKIKFKNNFGVGRFSSPEIDGVYLSEEAYLARVEYGERVFFNYPQSATVIDVIVSRLSKRQTRQIDQGMAFIPAEQMEKAINAEIVLPENIDFNNVLEIIYDWGGLMNLKEKLMEDHPQLSEMKIEEIIEESEEKVGRGGENAKRS